VRQLREFNIALLGNCVGGCWWMEEGCGIRCWWRGIVRGQVVGGRSVSFSWWRELAKIRYGSGRRG